MMGVFACRTTPPNASCAPLPWGETFAGSDEGGRRAAAIYTLIATAKLNDVDPQTWLADALARLPDHPAKRIHELLPWNWRPQNTTAKAA
jgi:transposase